MAAPAYRVSLGDMAPVLAARRSFRQGSVQSECILLKYNQTAGCLTRGRFVKVTMAARREFLRTWKANLWHGEFVSLVTWALSPHSASEELLSRVCSVRQVLVQLFGLL